jgi:hypothetical protein
MKLTKPHEKAVETAIHHYELDLIPIGRAYLDDLDHLDFRESGVYVLYKPIDLSPETQDCQSRIEMLQGHYLPELAEDFLSLETDRRELSSMLSKGRMGLSEEETSRYERHLPLGKSREYDVFVKGGRGKLEVLALRETHTIHTGGTMRDHDLIPL